MMARRSELRQNSCVDRPRVWQEPPGWGACWKALAKGEASASHRRPVAGIEGSKKIFYSEAIHGWHNCLPVHEEPTIGIEPTTY